MIKKIVLLVVLGVVVLVAVGAGILFARLNSLVENTVESQATQSLELTTTVDSADVSPFRGKLSLNGLAIDSPPGFTSEIFTLGEANLAVTYSDLRQDPVRVSEVSLQNPRLVLEQKDLKLNLQRLIDLAKEPTDPNATQLVIGQLNVVDPVVVLRPGLPGLAEEVAVTLPTLQLKDIGTGAGAENGAAISEVLLLVMQEMAAKAAESGQLPPELQQLLTLNADQLAAHLRDELGRQVTERIGGELGNVVGEVLKDPKAAEQQPEQVIGKGIDAILKSRQKDDPK